MINGNKKIMADHLGTAFGEGYKNAAASLAKMIGAKIDFSNFHHASHKLSNKKIGDLNSFNLNGANLLLTTEVFGDVTGKSYLLLSEHDFDQLTIKLKNYPTGLKEEFVKELDNILSAAVITKLSNQLQMKMYGDIPILAGQMRTPLNDLIYDDFSSSEEIYINSAFFTVENDPLINPFFIWVMNSSIIKKIEENVVVQ